jgi:hypothetical protein
MTKTKATPAKSAGAKTKPAGARRRGAQAGNKNALRYGCYSRQFRAEEIKRLDEQEPTDVKAEIELLRVMLDRLTDQLDFDPVYQPGKDENGAPIQTKLRDNHYLKQLNTMTLIAQSIATLARTEHLIHGKTGSVQDAILQALEELRLEMGL